jgi:hypothetical protein
MCIFILRSSHTYFPDWRELIGLVVLPAVGVVSEGDVVVLMWSGDVGAHRDAGGHAAGDQPAGAAASTLELSANKPAC